MRTTIIIPFLLFIVAACNNHTITTIELSPYKRISEIKDSSFFKDVMGFMSDGKFIYASDTYTNRVLKFDMDMEHVASIGEYGQGPENFMHIGKIMDINDTLYVLDIGGLKRFTKQGAFIESISLSDFSIDPHRCCKDEEGNIYASSQMDTYPIVKYSRNMEKITSFGERITDKYNSIFTNNYLLNSFNNHILAIKKDDPLFKIYDKYGNLKFEKELMSPVFNSRLTFKKNEIEKNSENNKKSYNLFESSAIIGNRIYLLFIDNEGGNYRTSCNKVAEIIYENNDLFIDKIYQLEDGNWYISIQVIDNKLICYNGTKQEIQIFNL